MTEIESINRSWNTWLKLEEFLRFIDYDYKSRCIIKDKNMSLWRIAAMFVKEDKKIAHNHVTQEFA